MIRERGSTPRNLKDFHYFFWLSMERTLFGSIKGMSWRKTEEDLFVQTLPCPLACSIGVLLGVGCCAFKIGV